MDSTPSFAPAPPALEERFREPPGFAWGHFTARDGARLRWGRLSAGSARDCILVGGFLEFVEKYFELVRDLHGRGFNVWCLDWRGQGGSMRNGSRPAARAPLQDAEDLTQFITTVSPRKQKRLLIAHSMGAAISLLALHQNAAVVDAAVLSAPMLRINTGAVPRWAARLLAATMTAIGRGENFVPGAGPWPDIAPKVPAGSAVSNDPARSRLLDAWFSVREDLRQDGPTYGWLNSAFSLTAQSSRSDVLSTIATPILMASAGHDVLVDPAAHVRAAALLPNCRLISFAEAKHELFHETDAVRGRWLDAIDAFVAEHVKPGA